MLDFITIVVAILVAQVSTAIIAIAVINNKRYLKWLCRWAMKYMNVCQEVIEEMEEAE